MNNGLTADLDVLEVKLFELMKLRVYELHPVLHGGEEGTHVLMVQ